MQKNDDDFYKVKNSTSGQLSELGQIESNRRREELDGKEMQLSKREEQLQVLIDQMIEKEKLMRDLLEQTKTGRTSSIANGRQDKN